MNQKITKAIVIEMLEKINEKDFQRVIDSVESAIAEEEKARASYKNFDPGTGTLRAFRELENRVKVCGAIKTNKLKEFFDLFTERARTFGGLSVIRKNKNEIQRESME